MKSYQKADKLRVLLVAINPVGGIRTFFRYVYSSPMLDDYDFTFVTPDPEFEAFAQEFIPQANVITVQAKAQLLLRVRQELKSKKYNGVHSHGYTAGAMTQLAATFGSIPHVMTAHDMLDASLFYGFKGRLKKWLLAKLLARVDAFHTVTEDAKQNLQEYFPAIKQASIFPILHGVDTYYFRDGKTRALKEELELPEHTLLLGFFGRFMPVKGFRLIVDAVHILQQQGISPDDLVVSTFGWGEYIREDYEYLTSLGLSEFFIQRPATNDMPSALKGVDCAVMPSVSEACGLLAMEALAAGTAIIASNCIGLREVVEDTPALVIDVGDAAKLATHIKTVMEQIDTLRQQFSAYQDIAVDRFSITKPIEKLANLYESTFKESIYVKKAPQ